MIEHGMRVAKAFATRRIPFELDLVPMRLDRMPLKKLVNWVLTESSVHVKPERPWGMPTVLSLEPTSKCNLRCPVCPVTTGMDRATGHMDFDLFRRIVDEVSETLLVMLFWDWGEPLLNPKAHEMIRYATDAGIRVACSTNGHLLAKREAAEGLVESGLDLLVFSVDGIVQETYQEFRGNGKLDTALDGIRKVVAAKRAKGLKKPLVNFRFIVTRQNQHETPQLREFTEPLGVDVLTLRKFHAVPNPNTIVAEAADEMVPDNVLYQLPARPDDKRRAVRLEKNPCRVLWNCPTIHFDGAVCSCFMDHGETHRLGSLKEQSFREIWHGDAYRELRRRFREGWQDLPLCGGCAEGYEGGDIGKEANAEIVYLNGMTAERI